MLRCIFTPRGSDDWMVALEKWWVGIAAKMNEMFGKD